MSKKPKMGRDPLAGAGGIDSLIRDTRQETGAKESRVLERFKRSPKAREMREERGSTVKRGLKDGFTRATFIVREEHLEKLKASAYWERKDIKDVVDEALEKFLKGKHIKPIPEEK